MKRDQCDIVPGLCSELGTSEEEGLTLTSPEEFEQRRREYGSSRLPEPRAKCFLQLVYECIFGDMIMVLLVLAAVATLVIDLIVEEDKKVAWMEGTGILAAVAIVSLVTAWQDYRKEQ